MAHSCCVVDYPLQSFVSQYIFQHPVYCLVPEDVPVIDNRCTEGVTRRSLHEYMAWISCGIPFLIQIELTI